MQQYQRPNDKAGSRSAIAAFAKAIPNRPKHENAAYIDEIRTELEQWNIPVTVIFPDGDMAWKPEEGKHIARILQNADFHLIQNSGHYVQEDAGQEVAKHILNFVNNRVTST